MTTRLTLIHAMSPLHAGTGQSVGAIDLPIARERPTGIPLVPGSSIKGSLRARSTAAGDTQITRDVFGPETAQASEHAGSVQFSDAHLLLLPVRSVRGTFAWATSRYLLQRFARTAKEAGVELKDLPQSPAPEGCTVLGDTLKIPVGTVGKVVFEDLDFTIETGQEDRLRQLTTTLGQLLFPAGSSEASQWQTSLLSRICLLHDDMMSYLLDTATEVNAHIRLDNNTKTVAPGALWYQEALPAESVLAGIVIAGNVNAANGRLKRLAGELLDHVGSLTNGLVQLGGKSNTGLGSCFVRIAGGQG
jgi:CRISPR-associated protein Cmr4